MEGKELVRIVTPKGQVTIPVEIRQLLGIKANDRVVFTVAEMEAAAALDANVTHREP